MEDKTNPGQLCLHYKTKTYNEILRNEYNLICPEIRKDITCVDNAPWFNSEIKDLIKVRRAAESKWRRSRTQGNRQNYVNKRNEVIEKIRQTKRNYYNLASENEKDLSKLYKMFDSLLGTKKEAVKPEGNEK